MRIIATGVVYRNPVPNIRSLHAFFPSVAAIPEGDLIVTFDLGSAMENRDVRSFLTRSADGGKNWSPPKLIVDPEDPDRVRSTSFRMSRIPNRKGTLLGLVTIFNRSHPDDGLANPVTDGFVQTDFALTHSTDDGQTWSPLFPIDPPIGWRSFETCSPILALDENRWILPTATWRDWNGHAVFGLKAIQFFSEDGGRSWNRAVTVMDDWEKEIAHWEQKVTRLRDGRLLAVCWTYDVRKKRTLNNRYAFSENAGETYGVVRESPLVGETCTPVPLPDGRVFMIYRRKDREGLWGHVCRFEGETWIPLEDFPLWGTNKKSYVSDWENTFERLGTLRFGYPQATFLSDGTLFIVFWCFEDCVSNIRWIRLDFDE